MSVRTKKHSRHTLHLVAAAAAVTAMAPAFAQQGPSDNSIQEITVTSQRRSTLASKTPVSLVAMGGDDLKAEGALDTRRLADLVPNVQIGNGALGAVEVSMRGIGSSNNTEVGDPAAGVSIDGIFLGRPQMAGAGLYDLERVEILRGPQGTLYGRNSTAGAINIITNKPRGVFEGAASVAVGNYNLRQADAMLNVPLNESAAVRAVLSRAQRDGTVDTAHAPNAFTKDKSDLDNTSARILGRMQLDKDSSLLLSADISRDRGAGPGAVNFATVQANPTGAAGRYVPTSKYEGRADTDAAGVSAEYKQLTRFGEVTVLAGQRSQQRDLLYSIAAAGAGAFNHTNFKQTTAEARLASTGSESLQWVTGVYSFNEKGSPIVLQAFGPSTLFYQDPMKTDSHAIFGQATYALTQTTRLTGGLRETWDSKARSGCAYPFSFLNSAGLTNLTDPNNPLTGAPDANTLAACPTANVNNVPTTNWNKLTWRLGVDHNLAPNSMVFATLSTGFKAGGFNDGNLAAAAKPSSIIYAPENLTAFEIGMKSKLLDNKLQINISAFSYDYTDLQVSSLTTCASGVGLCTLTTNAGKAKSSGLEMEGQWRFSQADRLNFGLGLTDAKYTSFTTSGGFNWADRKMDKAPGTSLNLGWSHQFALASGASISTYVGTRYSAKYVLSNPAQNLQFEQASYTKTDAHVTYRSADDRWDVQIYARNLENRNVATAYQFSGGQHGVYLSDPRMVGVRSNFRF